MSPASLGFTQSKAPPWLSSLAQRLRLSVTIDREARARDCQPAHRQVWFHSASAASVQPRGARDGSRRWQIYRPSGGRSREESGRYYRSLLFPNPDSPHRIRRHDQDRTARWRDYTSARPATHSYGFAGEPRVAESEGPTTG